MAFRQPVFATFGRTCSGDLFTVFGEHDIAEHDEGDGCISIEVAGIDMYNEAMKVVGV